MSSAALTVIAIILRLLLSVILLRAVLHKIRDRRKFQSELAAYQLLPTSFLSLPLLPIATYALIAVELLTSITLLDTAQATPALLAASLFAVYGAAMAINIFRKRTDIDCGCSGPSGVKKTIAWPLVLRNVVLVLLALFCAVTPIVSTAIHGAWVFMILAGALVALLLYEAIEQAIANTQGYQRWTH